MKTIFFLFEKNPNFLIVKMHLPLPMSGLNKPSMNQIKCFYIAPKKNGGHFVVVALLVGQ